MPDNTLLVGLIGAGSALAGVVISASVQLFVSHRAHEQSIRDESRARKRQCYAKIYWAAYVQKSVAARMPERPYYDAVMAYANVPGAPNPFEKSDRLLDEMTQADAQAQEALATLLLEGDDGDEEIVKAYTIVFIACGEYITKLFDKGERDATEIYKCFAKLQTLMRLRYGELEKMHNDTSKYQPLDSRSGS